MSATVLPNQVVDAWRHLQDNTAPPPREALGVLLDGLPFVSEGLIEDGAGNSVSLHDVTAHLLSREDVNEQVSEFARRLLALGFLTRPDTPEEDVLLNPAAGKIDPLCGDAALSLVRAVTAVELERSALLGEVVVRRLDFLEEAGLEWLVPLLHDVAFQCLLVTCLASGPAPLPERLWRRLLLLYQATPVEEESGKRWPDGPLSACCVLGLVLSRPGDHAALDEFRTADWEGWSAEALWPTRHPGKDMTALREVLTERALVLLKLPDRKLWRRQRVKRLLPFWPPLETFCVDSPASTK
jgi:hypothetical protein